jgi:hypothetical protein
MRRGIPNLLKDGTRHRSGLQEAVLKNLGACKELANITITSMGPNGQWPGTKEQLQQNWNVLTSWLLCTLFSSLQA